MITNILQQKKQQSIVQKQQEEDVIPASPKEKRSLLTAEQTKLLEQLFANRPNTINKEYRVQVVQQLNTDLTESDIGTIFKSWKRNAAYARKKQKLV